MTQTKSSINTTPCTITDFTTCTFINSTYFDMEHSYHDTARGLYCIMVDMDKLGTLNSKQIKDVNHILNLHRQPIDIQNREQLLDRIESDRLNKNIINRTFIFEIGDSEGFDPNKVLNICLFDLDTQKIISRKTEWNSHHPVPVPKDGWTDDTYNWWKKAEDDLEGFGKMGNRAKSKYLCC